jgi:hypothetical protein
MIVLKPPALALTPPPSRRAARSRLLMIDEPIVACEAGGLVRIDVYGQVCEGRVVAMLSPEDAKRLATELALIAKKLSPQT